MKSIELIEKLINDGKKHMVIDINNIGTVSIDLHDGEFDMNDPIEIYEYNSSPDLIIHTIDWVVSMPSPINVPELTAHIWVLYLVYKLLFIKCLGIYPTQDVLDTACIIHSREVDAHPLTPLRMSEDLCQLVSGSKRSSVFKWYIDDHINRRFADARKILDVIEQEYMNKYSINAYAREIYALINYVAKLNNIKLY